MVYGCVILCCCVVLCLQWFKNAISPVRTVPHYATELLFQALVPIYEFHCHLLDEIEQRVSSWYVVCDTD